MPLYQTEEDRLREVALAQRTAECWGLEFETTPTKDRIDIRFFEHGELVAIGEAKTRWNHRKRYETYAIDESKIVHLRSRVAFEGVPGFLIVHWTSKPGDPPITPFAGWIDCSIPYAKGIIHRRDRGDPLDRDRAAHYDPDVFTEISVLPGVLESYI